MIRRIRVNYPKRNAARITARNAHDKTVAYGPAWQAFCRENPVKHKLCQRCQQRSAKARHHLIPVGKGGKHLRSNVDFLCDPCHDKLHGGRLSRQRNARF